MLLISLVFLCKYSKPIPANGIAAVVICFKFSNFAYANTVSAALSSANSSLLFALNLVTLLMQIQFSKK